MTAKGECPFCHKLTRQKNWFGEFRHTACWDVEWERRSKKEKREAEDRKQIELYKQAIREVEAEKLNDKGQ